MRIKETEGGLPEEACAHCHDLWLRLLPESPLRLWRRLRSRPCVMAARRQLGREGAPLPRN